MVIVSTVSGNLLDATEKYIAQQCNCNTLTAHGLSQTIADRWSYGDVYSDRKRKSPNSTTEPDEPGSVILTEPGPGETGPTILHMMAQWTPSRPGNYSKYYPRTHVDSRENRVKWFKQCLDIIDSNVDDVVAMPDHIGCGLAGGDWKIYRQMLEECRTKIRLYKL